VPNSEFRTCHADPDFPNALHSEFMNAPNVEFLNVPVCSVAMSQLAGSDVVLETSVLVSRRLAAQILKSLEGPSLGLGLDDASLGFDSMP